MNEIKFLKTKAVFQIVVMVCAIFAFSVFVSDVYAEDEGKECCEKLDGFDEYCIFTDANKCDADYKHVGVTCDGSGYCDLGCCYDAENGLCSQRVNKAVCQERGGIFDEDPSCEIPQCVMGCCVTPSGCGVVTKNACERNAEIYNFELNFNSELINEIECNLACKSQEVGCCISSSGEDCYLGIRSSCNGDFRENQFCSQVGECNCVKENHKGVLSGDQSVLFEQEDNVHWFDSCGNPEWVVGTKPVFGSINDFEPIVGSGCKEQINGVYQTNIQNENCGFCDVAEGSVAGKDEDKGYVCKSLNCGSFAENKDVFKWVPLGSEGDKWIWSNNGYSSGKEIKNFDSWCYYEGGVGFGRDLVGSRHHLFRCVDGEIIHEPGSTDRSEICVMDFSEESRPSATLQSNDAVECLNFNQDDSSCGGECADIREDEKEVEEYKKIICCNEQRCLNSGNLCYWDGINKMCLPHVSPGGNDHCSSLGDMSCVSVWEYKPLRISFSLKKKNWKSWKCIQNCGCWNRADEFNFACNSLGDCGANYNVVGKLGEGGEKGGYTFEDDDGHNDAIDNANVLGWNVHTQLFDFDYVKKPGIKNFYDEGDELISYLPGNSSDIFRVWKTYNDAYTTAMRTIEGYRAFKTDNELWDRVSRNLGWTGYSAVDNAIRTVSYQGPLIALTLGYSFKLISLIKPFSVGKGFLAFLDQHILQGLVGKAIVKMFGKQLTQQVTKEAAKVMLKKQLIKYMGKKTTEIITTEMAKEAFKGGIDYSAKKISEKVLEQAITEFGKEVVGKTATEVSEQVVATQVGVVAGKGFLGTVMTWMNWIGWALLAIDIINLIWGDMIEVEYAFTCQPWIASSEIRDQECGKCAEDSKNEFAICDDLRCKSLGSHCEFVGEKPDGSASEIGLCIQKDNDNIPPKISFWDAGVSGRTSDVDITESGYKITKEFDGSEPIVLGIQTNEDAGCWISKKRDIEFDDMIKVDDQDWQKEHKVEITFSSEDFGEDSLYMFGGGEKIYYVACKDVFDNEAPRYKIQFKVKEQPPITSPTILNFEPKSGSYIRNGQTITNVYILVDHDVYDADLGDDIEAGCRYAIGNDKAYIGEFDVNMTCGRTLIRDSNGVNGFQCKAKLDGLIKEDNVFYFKCTDRWGNTNDQSQPVGGYHLMQTENLKLQNVGIKGDEDSEYIYYDDVTFFAETESGAEDGIAECRYLLSFGETSNQFYERMNEFSQTDSSYHEHSLVLVDGAYYVDVVCRDKAGNEDKGNFEFNVDTTAYPRIIRMYTQYNALHILLDHEAETCRYDVEDKSFDFDESSLQMDLYDEKHFQLSISDNEKFHIICKDKLTGVESPVYTIYV